MNYIIRVRLTGNMITKGINMLIESVINFPQSYLNLSKVLTKLTSYRDNFISLRIRET